MGEEVNCWKYDCVMCYCLFPDVQGRPGACKEERGEGGDAVRHV